MNIQHPYLDTLLEWASREDAIRALVITGSLARADGTIDEYSDLDIQVITSDIKRYTDDDSWLDDLGTVWIRFPLHKDVPYRLVWFSGGIKIDFQFLPADALQADQLTDEYRRGYHILLDKDDRFRDLPPSPRIFPQPPLPDVAEIHTTINEFWFEALHVAQFIRRRDFWVVKHRDWTMKTNLLRMLQWQIRLARREPVNTWLLGRRIAQWADADAYDAIKRIWGGWHETELWDALLLQIDLFRRLSREVVRALGESTDDDAYQQIEAYIRKLRWEDSGKPPRD